MFPAPKETKTNVAVIPKKSRNDFKVFLRTPRLEAFDFLEVESSILVRFQRFMSENRPNIERMLVY